MSKSYFFLDWVVRKLTYIAVLWQANWHVEFLKYDILKVFLLIVWSKVQCFLDHRCNASDTCKCIRQFLIVSRFTTDLTFTLTSPGAYYKLKKKLQYHHNCLEGHQSRIHFCNNIMSKLILARPVHDQPHRLVTRWVHAWMRRNLVNMNVKEWTIWRFYHAWRFGDLPKINRKINSVQLLSCFKKKIKMLHIYILQKQKAICTYAV